MMSSTMHVQPKLITADLIFGKLNLFREFPVSCQKESVLLPASLS